MSTPSTVFVATCDLAALVRGRSVPAASEESVLRSGTGWVPANLAITCFDELTEGPFDSTGDLRLIPDPDAAFDLPAIGSAPPLRVYLGTQTTLDGTPWDGDARSFALRALAELEERHGLRVISAFEHEFVLEGLPSSTPAFSLQRYRLAEPFGSELLAAATHAGLEPDTWLAEYGADQFEFTVAPAEGIRSADRAIVLRELVRDLARANGLYASFAPMMRPGATGTGVHVHLSLIDAAGDPVLAAPDRDGGLSELGARFAAGIVRHAASMIAVTAPSPSSSLRLGEHHWSSAGAYLAQRDREALLRICPTTPLSSTPQEKQFNLEFRAADATANPWLVLGLLVRAGLAGLDGYEPETVLDGPPAEHPAERRLPASGAEALAALEADETVRSWLPATLLDAFIAVRRAEQRAAAGWTPEEVCRRIADVY